MDEADEEADVVFESLADSEVEFDLESEFSRNLKMYGFLPEDELFLPSIFSLTVSGATPEIIADTPKYTATPIPPPIISTRIIKKTAGNDSDNYLARK